MARVDPGLLNERLKPPIQKDQPLADKLVLIPFLILMFGGMGMMAADAALALVDDAAFRAIRGVWPSPGGDHVHLLDHA